MPQQRDTSELDIALLNRLRSEQMFKQQLRDLKEATRRQLLEAERKQREELERRIQQNALLSTFTEPESTDQRQLDCQTKYTVKSVFIKRDEDVRTSAQTSDKGISHKLRQSERAKSPPAWVSSTNQDSVRMSRTAQLEEEARGECQKKFRALPVPNHVSLPRYQEMMELREKERKQGLEQRKNLLLSTQKPFSFHEREKEKREKREKLSATLKQASQDQKAKAVTVRKRPQNEVKLSSGSELKDQDLGRKVDTHIEAQETLRKTTVQHEGRAESGSSKLRTAERTKKEMLGFLDEKPSFQPKILQQVPDFSKLYKAFQTAALIQSTERKDEIKCRPFYLRTSALPVRQRRMSPEPSQQEPKVSNLFSRSRSLGALTSLSADTLPTYITDAARKRSMAIRKSMELRESKQQESANWMRRQQMRSQAMKKMIGIHAKLLDPCSSLKEQYDEKLQHHREADLRRSRDYRRELRDMKARVSERPFLFEQVKQRTAKALAEQMYSNKLKNAGLNERFVEANGEAVEGASSSSRSDDGTDANDRSAENDISSREENADDGQKIEDVEEKSVKSKREEMP